MAKRINKIKEAKVVIKRNGQVQDDLEAVVDDNVIRAINEDLDSLYRNIWNDNIRSGIDPKKIRHAKVTNVLIGTSETPVRHALGVKPHTYNVILRGSSAWWQTKEPDNMNVYIAATESVSADIIVEG